MNESEIILKLQHQLKEAEKERLKAAQYGLQLLESQSDLQNQLEEQRREMTSIIENLEQEKYTLSRDVELKNRMAASLTLECENLKQQQKVCLDQLERSHIRKVCDLKDKMEKLKAELDEARLSEKQLKQKLDHQAEVLCSKSEDLRVMSERVHETMSSEMVTLQLEINELQSSKALLQEETSELQYKQQQLILVNCNLNRQVERLQMEKEEREKEAVSYFNSLEKAREANQELQIQLDQALQQAQDPNSKGNSLFAEVEDRRAQMERQLISVTVQYRSLQKWHSFSRQQMHRMKVQIATLLQLKGSQTDPEQLERLQSMIEQKNSEIEKLLVKVHQLEKCQQQNNENRPTNVNTDALVQGDEVYYVDLLKMKLKNSSKEIEKMKDELSLQRMKALAESQQVLELERKLFTNERQLRLSKSENMKLRVNLDELKIKYEPEEILKLRAQKRRREQLPVDDFPENEDHFIIPFDSISDSASNTNREEKKDSANFAQNETSIQEISGVEFETPSCSTNADKPGSVQPVKERRRVRIAEDVNNAQALSESDCTPTISDRSSAGGKSFESTKAEENDLKACEKKSRQRGHPVLHVSSKPGAPTQCPQQ